MALPAVARAEDPPFLDWNSPLPGEPLHYQPSKDADCVGGDPKCVEETLTEMYRRFDSNYATCDHNAAFGITYIRVTEAIRLAVQRGVYEEPAWLGHQDRLFARMYFASYDRWKNGERDKVPAAWLVAFDTGRDRSVTGLGNLLLSMNAHINRDMPYMLDSTGLVKPDGSTRKPDHDRGNAILNTLYDDVIRELTARFDETVDDFDVPGSTADDSVLLQTLQGWREGVWRNAERLSRATTPDERQQVSDSIESYANAQAQLIKSNTTSPSSAARDAHCAAYRRTHREKGGIARAGRARKGQKVRHRSVRVRVACPELIRDCTGTLSLMRGKRRLGLASVPSIGPGKSRVVKVKLSRRTRRVIRHRKRLAVVGVTASPSPWGTTRRASRPLKLRR